MFGVNSASSAVCHKWYFFALTSNDRQYPTGTNDTCAKINQLMYSRRPTRLGIDEEIEGLFVRWNVEEVQALVQDMQELRVLNTDSVQHYQLIVNTSVYI